MKKRKIKKRKTATNLTHLHDAAAKIAAVLSKYNNSDMNRLHETMQDDAKTMVGTEQQKARAEEILGFAYYHVVVERQYRYDIAMEAIRSTIQEETGLKDRVRKTP
jgi:hypothetical protein